MVRSILSILAGFAAWTVLWLVGGQAVMAAAPGAVAEDGAVSGTGILLVILVISVVCSLVAGLVCSLIANANVARASLILGIALLVVGIAVQAGMWDKMPVWYHITFLVLLIPMTMAGARLRRSGQASPAMS